MADHRRKEQRVSTPQRETRRPYRLRARAEAQARTRRRIAEAALELHETVGPARTTISAIADLAGVERLTVYRHFPDQRSLFGACSRRFLEDHPPPNLTGSLALPDPLARIEAVLLTMYGYYRETEPMMTSLLRDAPLVPLVAESLAEEMAALREVADGLAAGQADAPEPRRLRAAIGHALAFGTWRSLALDEGLTDTEAAALMTGLAMPAKERQTPADQESR